MNTTIDIPYESVNSFEIMSYLKQYTSCVMVVYNFIKDNNLPYVLKQNNTYDSDTFQKLLSLEHLDLITKHYYFRQCVISDACAILSSEEARKKNDLLMIKSYEDDIKELEGKIEKAKKPERKKKYRQKINKIRKKITKLQNKEYKTIFGGRDNFIKRCKKLISREEFLMNRLLPLYSVGSTERFNRLFEIKDDFRTIVFKVTKELHFTLTLQEGMYEDVLKTLYYAQQNKECPCTFRVDAKEVHITYDTSKVNPNKFSNRKIIKNRVLSFDLNPNYLGYTIVDWYSEGKFKIIKSGVYSIKELNDEYFALKRQKLPSNAEERIHNSNKRKHETFEICKALVNDALYYKCDMVSHEQLTIPSKDKNKGKYYNTLCNNLWNRNAFIHNIGKRCGTFHIDCVAIDAAYSSFVGNFLFRSLGMPDMCLAAFEIGRRGYQFRYNNALPKEERKKNVMFPDLEVFKDYFAISLEEFGSKIEKSWSLKKIYDSFKKSKTMYRLSLDSFNPKFYRFGSTKSKISHYEVTREIRLNNSNIVE